MKKLIIYSLIVGLMGIMMYSKLNKTRECIVTYVYQDMIMIEHPNGNLYTMNVDNNRHYVEGDVIEVVFDELYEWDSMYTIKGIK